MSEYITKSTIKSRGWTDKLIEIFLKSPDKEAKNPIYRCASPMKLYLIKRVEEIEQSSEFKQRILENKKRIDGSKQAVITKKQRLLDEINKMKIYLDRKNIDIIRKNAIHSYNEFKQSLSYEYGDFEYTPATEKSDVIFLRRIMVNYLRHNMSNYDEHLERIFGKVGKTEAYKILNTKIYDKIKEIYPEFAEECDMQLMRKIDEINEIEYDYPRFRYGGI